eukprot:3479908-Alexandrium_andersonii.AAC.1
MGRRGAGHCPARAHAAGQAQLTPGGDGAVGGRNQAAPLRGMAQGSNEHAPGFCLTGCSSGTNLPRQLGADNPPALGAPDSPAAGPAG